MSKFFIEKYLYMSNFSIIYITPKNIAKEYEINNPDTPNFNISIETILNPTVKILIIKQGRNL